MTMLLFRSEDDIDEWCAAKNEPRGDAVPLRHVWELSRSWYGNRMDSAYRGRSAEDAVAVFRSVGLTSDFWSL